MVEKWENRPKTIKPIIRCLLPTGFFFNPFFSTYSNGQLLLSSHFQGEIIRSHFHKMEVILWILDRYHDFCTIPFQTQEDREDIHLLCWIAYNEMKITFYFHLICIRKTKRYFIFSFILSIFTFKNKNYIFSINDRKVWYAVLAIRRLLHTQLLFQACTSSLKLI